MGENTLTTFDEINLVVQPSIQMSITTKFLKNDEMEMRPAARSPACSVCSAAKASWSTPALCTAFTPATCRGGTIRRAKEPRPPTPLLFLVLLFVCAPVVGGWSVGGGTEKGMGSNANPEAATRLWFLMAQLGPSSLAPAAGFAFPGFV